MEPGNKKRIALLLQYDGTLFNGWQIQVNQRTVQGDLEKALTILIKENVRITASGRTDTGVHALCQVVHFDTGSDVTLDRICIGLNGIMEKDVSVKNAFLVPDDFHARFSVVEREYTYLIYNNYQRTPFMKYRAMWVNSPLDIEYMKQISQYLIGEMDFASFCKKKSGEDNTIRCIRSIDIYQEGDLIKVVIKGTAFLHNMIRIIIGTIIDIIKTKRNPAVINDIIIAKNRDVSGFTAPAFGLYLSNVVYNPDLHSYKSAF